MATSAITALVGKPPPSTTGGSTGSGLDPSAHPLGFGRSPRETAGSETADGTGACGRTGTSDSVCASSGSSADSSISPRFNPGDNTSEPGLFFDLMSPSYRV